MMASSIRETPARGANAAQPLNHVRQRLVAAFQDGKGADRILPLEGIRGYAVFLVFLVHHHTLFSGYLWPESIAYRISAMSHTVGNSGVDLFFVLSGFLIYGHLLRRPTGYLTFLGRRARRIYPTFLFVLVLYVGFCHLVPSLSKLPPTPGAEALYIAQNLVFLPGIFPIEPLITVAWSLSYEWLFYLSIPIIIGWGRLRSWRRFQRILFFASLLTLCYAGYQAGLMPHIRVTMFLAGIVVYELMDSPASILVTKRGEWLSLIAYAVCFALLAVDKSPKNGGAFGLGMSSVWTSMLLVVLPAIVVCSIGRDGICSRLFRLLPLRWLGKMSYSYFLVHGAVLNLFVLVLKALHVEGTRSEGVFLAIFGVNIVLTLAASVVVYSVIEWPWSLAPGWPQKEARSASSGQRGEIVKDAAGGR